MKPAKSDENWFERNKTRCLWGFVGIISLGMLGGTIYSSIAISQRRYEDCYFKSCEIVEEECEGNGLTFSCYQEKITYTFDYKDQTYEYKYYLDGYAHFDAANETCNEFLAGKEHVKTCYFDNLNVRGSISFENSLEDLIIMLVICSLLVVIGAVYPIIWYLDIGAKKEEEEAV